LELLQSYPRPGNIRELQNVIERSVAVYGAKKFSEDLEERRPGQELIKLASPNDRIVVQLSPIGELRQLFRPPTVVISAAYDWHCDCH
jgi:transcriptional regulator with AAA-type ATPase domain